MRKCEDCKIILDPDVRFCPNCGRQIDEQQSVQEQQTRNKIGVLLTSANLHRARKDWDRAIADVTEALRLDPSSPEAASLLAGIYEERGDLDEAAAWLRFALDLDPSSTADRLRLERLNQRRIAASSDERQRARTYQQSWVLAGAAVVLFVLIVGVVLVALGVRGQRTDPRHARAPRGDRTEAPPIRSPGSDVGSRAGETASAGGSPPIYGGTSNTSSASRSARTAAETAIRDAASSSQTLRSSGGKIDDVIVDPRYGLVTVTFTLPANVPVGRGAVLKNAVAAARAAVAANAEVKFVTARCLMGSGTWTQIAFVGDTARATLEALGDDPAPDQLRSVFTNSWWNPQISD